MYIYLYIASSSGMFLMAKKLRYSFTNCDRSCREKITLLVGITIHTLSNIMFVLLKTSLYYVFRKYVLVYTKTVY